MVHAVDEVSYFEIGDGALPARRCNRRVWRRAHALSAAERASPFVAERAWPRANRAAGAAVVDVVAGVDALRPQASVLSVTLECDSAKPRPAHRDGLSPFRAQAAAAEQGIRGRREARSSRSEHWTARDIPRGRRGNLADSITH